MIAATFAIGLLLQAVQPAAGAAPPAARPTLPVLAFPEPGMDDPAAYQGYQTRFYRDSKGNAVQVYLEARSSRAVQVWADAANESAGFTVRDAQGRPVALDWGADAADVSDSGATRTISYRLSAAAPRIEVGWFLLGTMRVERDFQYARRHLLPFSAPAFRVAEESLLVAGVSRLPAQERQRHLALLGAASVAGLRSRLQPTVVVDQTGSVWRVRVAQASLDGRHHLALELRGDSREATVRAAGRTVSIEARRGAPVHLTVSVTTDAAPLTPLAREEIFAPAFLRFLAQARIAHDSGLHASASPPHAADSAAEVRYRRLEREVRSVELLSTAEKLMAGLPNFATYFGRDMLMTALMMRPIWSPAMSEHVIASVLRKLSPAGDVSHEEALGGQAIRENAAAYAALLSDYFRFTRRGERARADSVLGRARAVLRTLDTVRENYHMIDDEFQLPVLVARYLADSTIPADRKRAFLTDSASGGAPRLALLLREMALVSTITHPYVLKPGPTTLVGFVRRDSTHWRSASWRDSDAGYANGRFAMDINAIWVPRALESMARTLSALRALGFTSDALAGTAAGIAGTPLQSYVADSAALSRAIETWSGARRHFLVTLDRREMRRRIDAKLASLPAAERDYWAQAMERQGTPPDSLTFLALALDADGRPLPLVNTDPATDLFLDRAMSPETVAREVEPFIQPYPVGLLVSGLGPVVVNDAYASPRVWETFRNDAYHAPVVVWGREVNLLLLALANQIGTAFDSSGRLRDPALAPHVAALRDALRRIQSAVTASGLEHGELWSYRIDDGRLLPTRYGTGSDVQLWSTTDLAVQFMLARLPPP